MKKLPALLLVSAAGLLLRGAPAAAPAKPAEKAATQTAAQTARTPQKPVVPEKKQPYELWLGAQTRALKAAAAGKFDEALTLFDEAENAATQSVLKNQSLYGKADLLTGQGKYDEALAQLRRPLPRNRNTAFHKARVFFGVARIRVLQKRFDDAEAEFRKALEADAVSTWITADSHIELGKLCESRKDFKGALEHYTALSAEEALLPGLRARGVEAAAGMYVRTKEFAKALVCLDGAGKIEQIPADRETELALLRADILLKMNKPQEALKVLREAERIAGKSPFYQAKVFSRSAALLLSLKRYQEARNTIDRARAVRNGGEGYDRELHKRINRELAKFNKQRLERERKARARQQQLKNQNKRR